MKHNKYYYTRYLWVKLMRIGQRTGCHQLPERSFFFRQYQFPVCARCCGVLIGEIVVLVMSCFGFLIPLYIGFILAGIMLLDWGIQYLGILESNNIRRLATGFLGGLGTWTVIFNIVNILYRNIIVK